MWFSRKPSVSLAKSAPQPPQPRQGASPRRQPLLGGLARTIQAKAAYRHVPSFTDLLPWAEYLPDVQMLLHTDGQTVGAVYELYKAPIDGRSLDYQQAVRNSIQRMLMDGFPRRDDPYVLQTYVQDERGLGTYLRSLRQEIEDGVRETVFTKHYLEMLARHLTHLVNPDGVFDDPITGGHWHARRRRVRAVIYRPRSGRWSPRKCHESIAELEQVCGAVEDGLRVAGVGFKRLDGAGIYDWLVPWLNPHPALTEGDPYALLDMLPYPGDERLPFGWDFAGSVLFTPPRLEDNPRDGAPPAWWFDDRPWRFVSIEGLHHLPEIGHISAERHVANRVFTVFDRLPEDTVFTTAMVFWPAATLQNRYSVVVRNALGDGAGSHLVHQTKRAVEARLVQGEQLVSLVQGCYVNGDNWATLNHKTAQLVSRLGHYGLRTVDPHHDPVSPDLLIRALPMNYWPNYETTFKREAFAFSEHAANLLPVYGRFTGTGTPGVTAFNRSGELVTFDPLNPKDVKENSHLLITGSTGSGKSATLLAFLETALAVHNPRMIVIDGANSFPLFAEYALALDKKVHYLRLKPGSGVSLAPFADTLKLLETTPAAEQATATETTGHYDVKDSEKRDYLGEAQIAAQIMLEGDGGTGIQLKAGERSWLRKAIVATARRVRSQDHTRMIPSDLVATLREPETFLERTTSEQVTRLLELADGLDYYTEGLEGAFFNQREGNPWPEADVLVVELGTFIQEGYQGSLGTVIIGLMNHINRLVETYQADARPTVIAIDEWHLLLKHRLLGPFFAMIIRLWRKMGAALWAATHGLGDFPEEARAVLKMIEWWLLLAVEKGELEDVLRFKELSKDDQRVLLSARKNPPHYTEGAMITPDWCGLLRFVTPPETLALAMTERWEKRVRVQLMKEHDVTELEAAMLIAERMRRGEWTVGQRQ